MSLFLLVIAVALLGATGDILVNQWAKTQLIHWWLISIPLWIGAATVFGFALRQEHYTFGVMVIVILLLHAVLVLAWDSFIEGVSLPPTQWVGVMAAIAAMVLIEVGKK